MARNRLVHQLGSEISDRRVLEVLRRVPRELFVPLSVRHLAYEDIPLPIGEGQTISQPFIVALMSQALKLTGDEKVLELGTGSGYQTAILAELCRWVVSVERFPSLLDGAKRVLDLLGYANITLHLAEETLGWPEEAPYQAITVTAGAPEVPQELLDQLAMGGRLVVPVGNRFDQELLQVTKTEKGAVTRHLGACRFVPLVGKGAWTLNSEH